MKIEDFAEMVKDGVIKRLGEGAHVSVHRVNKNNGVVYTGLEVHRESLNLSPLVYLDIPYENFRCKKTTLPETVDYVVKTAGDKTQQVDMRLFLNYGSIEGNIVCSLINTERNAELLEDLAHKEFLDLSVVFQCMLASDVLGMTYVMIHNVHLKLWGVTVDDLFCAAEKNMSWLMGYELKSMKDVLLEIIESEQPEEADYDAYMAAIEGCIPIYVLSNRYRINGAACILYPTLLEDICDSLQGSFYIIPSSVHEVLILPSDNTDDSKKIREMIKEVNDTQIAAEEILSYSLYFYDREENRLHIV